MLDIEFLVRFIKSKQCYTLFSASDLSVVREGYQFCFSSPLINFQKIAHLPNNSLPNYSVP